jgi:hypothetical protein
VSNPIGNDSERELRDRALGLFSFLHDLSRIRTKTVSSLDLYEKVLWLEDIPREPGCFTAAWSRLGLEELKEDETWISIDKPRLPAPPTPPMILSGWLSEAVLSDSAQDMPALPTQRVVEIPNSDDPDNPTTEIINLSAHPEITVAWEEYVEKEWWPWAENDRRLKKIQKIYMDLFSIYRVLAASMRDLP